MSEYKLKLEFNNQSPNFTLGFECGIVYEKMRSGQEKLDGMFHPENREQLFEIAKTCGYQVINFSAVDEWLLIEFERNSEKENTDA